MIDLQEALQLLESGSWVSVGYVSFDAKKGTAGEIIRIPKCRISRTLTPADKLSSSIANGSESRLQNHSLHFTRNVVTPSGAIRKVHIRLLFSINNKSIL